MPYARYRQLVPGQKGFEHLKAWIDSYVGLAFDWEVQLLLLADEVPELRCGSGVRLGYSTWMRGGTYAEDADDLILGARRAPAGTAEAQSRGGARQTP